MQSVINTSSLIISNMKISITSSIKSTIRMIINVTQTQARHAAPDTEQHQHQKEQDPNFKQNKPQKRPAPVFKVSQLARPQMWLPSTH